MCLATDWLRAVGGGRGVERRPQSEGLEERALQGGVPAPNIAGALRSTPPTQKPEGENSEEGQGGNETVRAPRVMCRNGGNGKGGVGKARERKGWSVRKGKGGRGNSRGHQYKARQAWVR